MGARRTPPRGQPQHPAYAVATVHGLRGDDDARAMWLDIVDAVKKPGSLAELHHFGEVFDALLQLHRALPLLAIQVLDTPPEQLTEWRDSVWRTWCAALWAEAAVMSGHQDAAARIQRARVATSGNAIAGGIVDRAAALDGRDGDRDRLTAAAAALADAGCHYQWARTLVLIGGEQRARGESVLAAMGATAMGRPPE